MNIETMNINEVETRLSQIRIEMEAEGADIDALTEEVRKLNARKDALHKDAEKRAALRKAVGEGAGTVVASHEFGTEHQERAYSAESPEYRTAYLKNLRGEELTKEERTAFTHTTGNTAAPLPTTMLNQIWSQIGEEHPILGDVTVYRTGTTLEVVKHTGIAAGDAKTVAENTANDDEQNTFVKVTLSGKDFSKSVEISYAMQKMSLSAFEAYLINEISDRLGSSMAADIVAQIGKDMTVGNKVKTAAVKKATFEELAKFFGLLKRAKNPVVYATRTTIFNYLVGLVDTAGRPIFQLNAQDGAEGVLLGAKVKIEDAVAENKFLLGAPKKFIYNMVQDIMIENDKDIKKHVYVHSGYARAEGALVDPDTFAELDVKQA